MIGALLELCTGNKRYQVSLSWYDTYRNESGAVFEDIWCCTVNGMADDGITLVDHVVTNTDMYTAVSEMVSWLKGGGWIE